MTKHKEQPPQTFGPALIGAVQWAQFVSDVAAAARRLGLAGYAPKEHEPPSLASAAALAFRDHDATLRTLAEQERDDAADKPHEMILGQNLAPTLDPTDPLAVITESAMGQLYGEEVERQNRQLLAIVSGQSMPGLGPVCAGLLVSAGRTFDAAAMTDEELRQAARRMGFVARDPSLPPSYGSANVAPTNATFAPDFNDPDAIRIRPLEPIEGEATP